MSDECSNARHTRDVGIPARYNWQCLTSKNGAELDAHDVELLRELGTRTTASLLIHT